jgi:hypothetical protein
MKLRLQFTICLVLIIVVGIFERTRLVSRFGRDDAAVKTDSTPMSTERHFQSSQKAGSATIYAFAYGRPYFTIQSARIILTGEESDGLSLLANFGLESAKLRAPAGITLQLWNEGNEPLYDLMRDIKIVSDGKVVYSGELRLVGKTVNQDSKPPISELMDTVLAFEDFRNAFSRDQVEIRLGEKRFPLEQSEIQAMRDVIDAADSGAEIPRTDDGSILRSKMPTL